MKNLTVCDASRSIEVSKKFNTLASQYGTPEYNDLQAVRRDYPGFKVVVVAPRKATKGNKPSFKGLTYEYMEWYIIKYGPKEKEKKEALLAEFELQKDIAGCHSKSKRYPVVKNWFLAKFPEISKFGVPAKEAEEENEANVVSLPAANEEKKAG